MRRFIEGADRNQSTLLPECLDDWVGESNPVRVVDAFVEALDLDEMGFEDIEPSATGRPGYHPAVLLKLYIYGYLNRIQSSRRLEREARRNLEVIWLLQRLSPDDKTIADFRRDNGLGIRKVCAKFVELCRRMGLLTQASVAIDGSKFKAVNTRDKNFTKGKVERRRQQLEESVSRYLAQLDTADLQEPSETLAAKTAHLKEKLTKLKSEMHKLEAYEEAMLASPDQQISLTDPDSRSMATSGRGSGVVGYNVQVAVDTEHHLIIAHEVTNSGSDRAQLANMGKQAKAVLGVDKLEAVADRGYYTGEEIKACADADILVTLPKPNTTGMEAKGKFGKHDFAYLAKQDVYRCPAGELLAYWLTTVDGERTIRRYVTKACGSCLLKARCTTAKNRVISRWEHEHVMEDAQRRLDADPQAMRRRRETVEHPFGTLKMRMGATHFLTKRLPKVATEMALHVLAYNLTRVMNIMGAGALIAAIQA
ncbi:IS1182 family transposase (plasmid) [Bradyrhizobium sp. CB82]|uniref:IS1182 family transposase n=1 Tax=Bradyrhizobium sp. CB82 TaxID=3039159 RepID=UPI0024B11028|nr:IS1182 family transposase [Bradyrhizobium sp. CB82]WFU45860.1 IS1182 family transposase [Bradyrhizobium sp. CB82]